MSEFLDDFGVDLLDILQFDGYEAELGDEGVKGLKKGERGAGCGKLNDSI